MGRQQNSAANQPPVSRPAKAEGYSIEELARRWEYSAEDVVELLCCRPWVTVCIYSKRIVVQSPYDSGRQMVRGYVPLTSPSAQKILVDGTSDRVEMNCGSAREQIPFLIVEPAAVWTTADLRIMRGDVEALERERQSEGPKPQEASTTSSRQSTRDRIAYLEAAQEVLKREPGLRPSEVVKHPNMKKIGADAAVGIATRTRWIAKAKLCTNRNPGAPRKSQSGVKV